MDECTESRTAPARASGDAAIDSVPLLVASLVLGALLLGTILWMFWPNLLGLNGTGLHRNIRLAVPALVAAANGSALGFSAPQSAIRATTLMVFPPLLLASGLGFLSAMRPIHLVVVLALALIYGGTAIAGAVVGRASRKRLRPHMTDQAGSHS